MHISAYKLTKNELIPSLKILKKEFDIKEKKFKDIYKIGRTHLQDATPMTLGQEFGGFSLKLFILDKVLCINSFLFLFFFYPAQEVKMILIMKICLIQLIKLFQPI